MRHLYAIDEPPKGEWRYYTIPIKRTKSDARVEAATASALLSEDKDDFIMLIREVGASSYDITLHMTRKQYRKYWRAMVDCPEEGTIYNMFSRCEWHHD